MGRAPRQPSFARASISRVRRLAGRVGAASDSATPDGLAGGLVEEFSRRLVVGWISVPPGTPTLRVELRLDDFVVASTAATVASSMSGADSVLRGGGDDEVESSSPRVHKWQVPTIPSPPDDRRNSHEQIRTFSFRVRGIWPYVGKGTRVSVWVNGRPLPIHRHGMFLQPRRKGQKSLDELRQMFDGGYLLDQMGDISLRRSLDVGWQDAVMQLYRRVSDVLEDEFGLQVFLIYGTLLGAVREGGPIGHDADFDVAYLSELGTGAQAAEQMQDVALALVHAGLDVDCKPTALHIHDSAAPKHRIDLFHCYFDANGELALPFGAAGQSAFRRDDWRGLRTSTFLGQDALVPVASEKLVAHLYGDDWRQPKSGFNWDLDRTRWAPEGRLTTEQQTRVHWANFYSHHEFGQGSTFSEFVLERGDLPRHVIDIGCGDGRDSCALGRAGHYVLGLDQSSEGEAQGTAHAASLGLGDQVSFEICDVTDTATLRKQFDRIRDLAGGGAIAFYMRFFLHAISEHAQDGLLATIQESSRTGDLLLAEFRTLADEAAKKVHRRHYRRYIDAPRLRDELERRGFEVEYFTEQNGLSPYKDEDPVLCRVVAARRP
jgi:SAM-dependent methyltransferase